MKLRSLSPLFLAAGLAAAIAACSGGGGTDTPSTPSTPAPTPTPTPTPNPYIAACGLPLPPIDKSYGFKVKVQSEPTPNRKWLTASPQIRDLAYCQSAGLPGEICAPRFEDDPTRVACDHYLAGISDSGRPGPNWFEERDGRMLKCGTSAQPGESLNCDVRDESQYNLNVRAPGKYVACGGRGSTGSCGPCRILEEDWGVIHRNPAGLCKLN